SFNRDPDTGSMTKSSAFGYQLGHIESPTSGVDYLAWGSYTSAGAGVNTSQLVLNSNGNVGVGTTTPSANLTVRGTASALPASSGVVQTSGSMLRLRDSTNLVLDVGGAGDSGIWLQATDATNLATN